MAVQASMLSINLKLALLVFFGWFGLDALASISGSPMEGIYYPMASGRLKTVGGDWTLKPWYGAPMYFLIFASLWLFVIRKEGAATGARIASLFTAFSMPTFWIVSSVSADMYDLEINGYWLASMIYCNLSFFVFGFIGTGKSQDLYF